MLENPQLDNSVKEETTELLQNLIKNRCVNYDTVESGNEIKSVNTLIKYFESHDINSYEVFEPTTGRGNLLVTITGDSSNKSLTLQSHLDVVPVTGDWSVDPFSGVIKDGWLYGRGAIDMLMYTATQAVTIAHLVQSGWKPKGTLKFLAVADEEAGANYGAKWLIENVPEKIKSDYLIGELSGGVLETPSGTKMGIMNAEKGPGWVKMNIKGIAGHGSYPYKSKNALEIMSQIVTNMKNIQPEPVMTKEWKDFVKGLGLTRMNNFLLLHKRTVNFAINQLSKSQLGLAKVFHALTRMTVSPNLARVGEKINIIPDQAVLETDFRLLPNQDRKDIEKYLQKVIPKEFKDIIEVKYTYVQSGSSDPWNIPFTDILSESYQELYPNQKATPVFIPGVTDALSFRKIGIKCYGACVLTNKVSTGLMTELYHGVDERVPVEALPESVAFYSSVCRKFLK